METILHEHTALFEKYYKELIDWNSRMNLTSIVTFEDITTKHFLDSLSVVSIIPESAKKLIDIGSGAGFPGIPIKIARRDLSITLLESVGKKTSFLQHIISTLDLKNIEALPLRAEDLGHDKKYREQYDVATARAVAGLSTLIEYTLPFLKIGGIFIAQKASAATPEEIAQAHNALQMLGGKVQEIKKIEIAGLESRDLIIIEKIFTTPDEYPRKAGTPKKDPL